MFDGSQLGLEIKGGLLSKSCVEMNEAFGFYTLHYT